MVARQNKYEKRYAESTCYWGNEPSSLCDTLLKLLDDLQIDPKGHSLIDLGCGEGRNAIYLASKGFSVTGLDLSPAGLEKTRTFAKRAGLDIETIEADLAEFVFDKTYDVIFSTGTVHYIPPEERQRCFAYFRENTVAGGLHAISTLVSKPFIEPAPDAESDIVLFTSGELMSYYRDWNILHTHESIFECNSGGTPHRHAVNRVVARKP